MKIQWNDAGSAFHPASAPDFLPRRELEKLQLARLRAVVRRAYEKVPLFRQRMEARGLFADAGSLWGLDETAGSMGEVDDSFHVRAAAGVSLFVDTPFAPLRFNYAVPLKREDYDVVERFRFSIQTRF